MNCKRAQSEIALWVGGDLDDASIAALGQHLNRCPACDRVRLQMQRAMSALEDQPAAESSLHDSIWPEVSKQLPQSLPQGDRFNGWLPAIAMAAVCCLMLTIATMTPTNSPALNSESAINSTWEREQSSHDHYVPHPPRPPHFDTGFPRRELPLSQAHFEFENALALQRSKR